MANFKVVFQYTQFEKGFSEVFYRSAPSLEAAATFTQNFYDSMVKFRQSGVVLRKVRVSAVTNNRLTLLVNRNQAGLQTFDTPDVTGVACVLALASAATGKVRHVWIRGLFDKDVIRDVNSGQDRPSSALSNALVNYAASLVRAGFTIRSLVPIVPPAIVYNNISSLTSVADDGVVTINCDDAINLGASKRLIISQTNIKDFPGLNGHFTAFEINANQFKIRYNHHRTGTFKIRKGRIRPEEYEYGAITLALGGFLKFGTRDTGKNPLGGRGRRTATHIRSL